MAGGAMTVGAPRFGAAGQKVVLFIPGFLLASLQSCTFLLPLPIGADGPGKVFEPPEEPEQI